MQKNNFKTRARIYEPILPGHGDWPVVRLSRNRADFVEEVVDISMARIKEVRMTQEMLREEIELTMFKERLRVKENPWKVDPEDEPKFWSDIKKKLLALQKGEIKDPASAADAILRSITTRYAEEIAGNFRPTHYRMARTLVTFGFSRLLNAAHFRSFRALFQGELTLQDKIRIKGETDQLRSLAKVGTIVLVPTHFSNLDSITIGFVIHALGLPPFIYGAGLNLFNTAIFAYFMNSLGAYKVDRRKKNMIYLETLKTYSNLALQKGCHSLFFPGGTRSRSGMIEKKLKLGLLSTAMEAQRQKFLDNRTGNEEKIFVVPVVLNYNFVLEAVSLIKDYLAMQGQERYYTESDKYSSSSKILSFLVQFFTRGADISVTIGKGMDIFGNEVDMNGNSIDMHGREIDIREYYTLNGKITENAQRDGEYTRMLSDKIVKAFHKYARCSPSHLAAFIAFEIIRKRYIKLDLYSLFRLPNEDLSIQYNVFKDIFIKLRKVIFNMEKAGDIQVEDELRGEDVDGLLIYGIKNVGTFHTNRPLMINKDGNVISLDLKTLYYYRNRLDGYGLERYI